METGVAAIDKQHKELIKRINAFVAMGSKSYTTEEITKTLD
jgi:hemerythrin